MYRINLNKKHRLAPAAIAGIVLGIVAGVALTGLEVILIGLIIIELLKSSNRPDITTPIIYPIE